MGIGKFAAVGGVQGFGEGIASVGRQWSAEQHAAALSDAAALRERSLSELRGEIEGKSQQRGFEHSERMQTRQQTFQAGQGELDCASRAGESAADRASRNQKPQELLDYYKANANRLNAEARAIDQGLKYGEKKSVPNVKVVQDVNGTNLVDQTSGAIGIIQPGQPAVRGETRWFGPNDPDQPATAPNINWSLNGQPLRNGLSDLYPAIRERTTGSTSASPSGRTGWDSSSGQVFVAGQAIGTAKSEAEARQMVDQGRTSDPLNLRPGLKPPAGQRPPIESFVGSGPRAAQTTAPASSGSGTRVIMPELVTAPAGRPAPKERHEASMSKLKAENEAHFKQRISGTFKSIIETGRYTPDDRPFLELALERGALTASERQTVSKMLEAIGEAEFAGGYEKGSR